MTDENRPQNNGSEDAPVDLTEQDLAPDDGGPEGEERLREQISELNDRVLRLAAELENTRRRAEREKAEAGRYAISNFARDLLTIVDTFQRALDAAPAAAEISPETVTALVEGLKMTDRELLATLERHGVKRIDPKGERFDPNLHQAVAQIPGDQPAGYVQEVAQPGFTIGDRVLRAAMVMVSNGAGPQAPAAESGDPNPAEPRLDRKV